MAAKLHFIGHRITDLEFHVGDQFHRTAPEQFEQMVDVQNKIDAVNKRIEVFIKCEVTARSNDFRIQVQIKGMFQGDPDVETSLLSKFATQNAPAILFPFARSAVASVTAQANIPVIYLATVNFSQPNRPLEQPK